MTSFPLLQLPLVAMEYVLCTMSPFELIDVSLASSRAKKVVKSFSKPRERFSVSFDNFENLISFRRGQKVWEYVMKTNQDHANMYAFIIRKYQKNTELLIKLSEEPLKNIMNWFDYAREVLSCKINSVTFHLGISREENRSTVDWIAAQSRTVNDLEISSEYAEVDDDLKYLVERIQTSETFNLAVEKYKDDFRMEIPGKPYHLHIDNSKFIDYNQLLRLKSPVIILRESILTSQEINRFLKSWMSCETHLELEALEISITGPGAMNEIMDLPHEKTNDPEIVKAFEVCPLSVEVEGDMFTIKRCDGKKRATVTVADPSDGWHLYLIIH
uniref:F-box domain-containing protein n=1 Tax=Caenorhabditis tropicalis TaxID=1561998 RepID=A0A1I7UU21_9PELO